MNTPSGSASPRSPSHASEIRSSLRLLAAGALCGLAIFASLPRMTRYWHQAADAVDQLHVRATAPSASLPDDATVRQLAGWKAR